jgi:hypothetical protein
MKSVRVCRFWRLAEHKSGGSQTISASLFAGRESCLCFRAQARTKQREQLKQQCLHRLDGLQEIQIQ